MMTIVVIALTIQIYQIIIIAHIHTISCRQDSNPDSPGSEHACHTTEPSAGRKPASRAEDSRYEGLV